MKKIFLVLMLFILLNSNFVSTIHPSDETLISNQLKSNNNQIDTDNTGSDIIETQEVNHDGIISPGEYAEKVIIDSSSNFELYYSLNGGTIYFALVADALGYVGIGFGSNMAGADYVMGYYLDGTVVEDGYGSGGVAYVRDTIQNVLSSSTSEDSTSTTLEFSRYLDTGDTAQDVVISLGVSTDLVWAISSTDSFGYHTQRGYATVTFNTFAPLPSENVFAVPSDSKVDLTWDAASDGGSPITNYHIYRSTTPDTYGSALASVSGSATTYIDTTVTNGVTYYYVITSENANGVSSFSNEVSVTPSGIITPPLDPTVVVSDSQVNISWSPPTNDGGSPITNYTIYRSDTQGGPYDLIGINTSPTGYSDNSVINGFTYWYVVTANNVFSESEVSNEVSASPVGVPTSPRYITALLRDTNITLSWADPISDGGFAISDFSVYRSETSGGPYTFLGINSSTTEYFENISLDLKTYFFVVTANNSAGESKHSNELMVKFAKVPFMPVNFNITVAYNQAILNWTAPFDNDYPIEKYNIYRATTDDGPFVKIGNTNITEYVDLTASNGQKYYYVIAAENSQGEGVFSAQLSAVPGTVPDEPLNVIGTPSDAQVSLTWLLPQNNGGSEVANYSIYRSDTQSGLYDWIKNTEITQYVDTGLINGKSYYYSISAINEKGEGNKSYPIKIIPGSNPSVPQDIIASTDSGIVTIGWSESDGEGYGVVEYRVYRSYTSGGPFTYLGTSAFKLEYLDNNTIAGVTNFYVVSAVNAMGESNFSHEVNATLFTLPSPPQNLIAVSQLGQVGLLWNQPNSNGGSQIIRYFIYRSEVEGGEYVTSENTTSLSFIDSGLEINQTYYYAVTAINEIGESVHSNIVSVTVIKGNLTASTISTISDGGIFKSMEQILMTISLFVSLAIIGGTAFYLKKSINK